jgi:hypothetical protein
LSSGRAQKPSSARPIQLKANRQQPNAATDARVAIVFADDMTRTLCGPPMHSVEGLVLKNGKNSPG